MDSILFRVSTQKMCVVAVLTLSGLLAAPIRAEDWPQWRGLNRDGVWGETGIMESFPDEGLKVLWSAPVGWGWSSPVVAQGRVFVTDSELVQSKVKERVHCFDATNGNSLWTYAYDETYPEWVYVAGQEMGPKDPDMRMTAVDIQKEFPNCEVLLCQEIERDVVEGEFHTGVGSVVQFIGQKKS